MWVIRPVTISPYAGSSFAPKIIIINNIAVTLIPFHATDLIITYLFLTLGNIKIRKNG